MRKECGRLAAAGEGRVVSVALGLGSKTAAGERLPEKALVRAIVAVGVSLDPGVACRDD